MSEYKFEAVFRANGNGEPYRFSEMITVFARDQHSAFRKASKRTLIGVKRGWIVERLSYDY